MARIFFGHQSGAASPDVTLALSGQAVTCSAGTLGLTHTQALTGQAATASAGTITPVIGLSVALTGQAVTASAGTLVFGNAIALTGSEVAAAAGTLIATIETIEIPRPAHQAHGGGRGRDETREYLRKKAIQKLPIRLLPETVEHIAARAKKQAWMPDEEIEAYYFTFWED